jgi:hypothetical protein
MLRHENGEVSWIGTEDDLATYSHNAAKWVGGRFRKIDGEIIRSKVLIKPGRLLEVLAFLRALPPLVSPRHAEGRAQ